MKLNRIQTDKLRKYKEELDISLFGFGFGVPVLFFIFSLIPMEFIPHRRARRIVDNHESLLSLIGVGPLVAVLLVLSAGIFISIIYSYQYLNVRKDLLEREMKKVRSKVQYIKVLEDSGNQKIDLWIGPDPKTISKIDFLGYRGFPRLSKGQEVEVILTKHAQYPVDIYVVESVVG